MCKNGIVVVSHVLKQVKQISSVRKVGQLCDSVVVKTTGIQTGLSGKNKLDVLLEGIDVIVIVLMELLEFFTLAN